MRWRSKSNRISRLVAHLRSRNPLLVETGFPASLLDLFLKNHHRFNSPKSHPNHNDRTDTRTEPDAVTITNTSSSDLPTTAGIEDEKDAVIGVNRLEGRSPRAKVAAVVFLVAALAIGTKRLAFGITVSAFLLLVLEYVGRYVPSAKAQLIEFVLQRFVILAAARKSVADSGSLMLINTSGVEQVFRCVQDSHDWGVSAASGEIELVEPEENVNQVGNCHSFSIRNVVEEKMSSGEEEYLTGRVMDGLRMKKRKSHSAKLKSKIVRKLVPKKLRHLKKDKKCKVSEAKFEDQSISLSVKEGDCIRNSSRLDGNVTVVSDLETEIVEHNFQVGPAKVDDLKQGSLSWPSDHPFNHTEHRVADCAVFGSDHSHELVKRNDIYNELVASNIQIDAKSNSSYLVLVVIVLVGLVGGRILSFLLAVGYFCILKSICMLRRKKSGVAVSVQR